MEIFENGKALACLVLMLNVIGITVVLAWRRQKAEGDGWWLEFDVILFAVLSFVPATMLLLGALAQVYGWQHLLFTDIGAIPAPVGGALIVEMLIVTSFGSEWGWG